VSQTITISPNVGPPTTKTLVSGSGFAPNSNLRLLFDHQQHAQAVADASGSFANVSLQVPVVALPGEHTVAATSPDGGTLAQTSFLVRTDWNQFHFSPNRQGTNPFENVLSPATVGGLKVRWKFFLDKTFDPMFGSPSVVGGVVYI
jgi:hypothetical protein